MRLNEYLEPLRLRILEKRLTTIRDHVLRVLPEKHLGSVSWATVFFKGKGKSVKRSIYPGVALRVFAYEKRGRLNVSFTAIPKVEQYMAGKVSSGWNSSSYVV